MRSHAAGTVYVEGIALWSPRLPGWEVASAVLRGEAEAPEKSAARPSPAILAPTERRRAPDTVAVALEVASRACESAGCDPKSLPSVFASTHGDLAISDYMCNTLAKTPNLTSPTRFHNSVHNAAAGYWTIGTGCLAPYTAISAHRHTFGQGLLETIAQVESEHAPVLYVVYDIEARGPLATMAPSRGLLGAALVLGPERTERSKSRLAWRLREGEAQPTTARPANLTLVLDNAMTLCLPLFEALAYGEKDGKPRDLVHTLAEQLTLDLTVQPLEANR